MNKSTIAEIRERFDKDVERFSNLETGQISTIDAAISLELITETAKSITSNAQNILDIGCGAGNYTLKMLEKVPNLNCTLLDLSQPMLERARQRVVAHTKGTISLIQEDIRTAPLLEGHFDIILAGAVLHHLREEQDWVETFTKLFRLLKPGGCLMISDLVTQDHPSVQNYIWERYGQYLEGLKGPQYRKDVFDYIEKEDSPRSVTFQLDLMKKIGFSSVEILHKNMNFAAFGGIK